MNDHLILIALLIASSSGRHISKDDERIICLPKQTNQRYQVSYHIDENFLLYENEDFCLALKLDNSVVNPDEIWKKKEDTSVLLDFLKKSQTFAKLIITEQEHEIKIRSGSTCQDKPIKLLVSEEDYYYKNNQYIGKRRVKRQTDYNNFFQRIGYPISPPHLSQQNRGSVRYPNGLPQRINNGYRIPSFAQPPAQQGHFDYYHNYDNGAYRRGQNQLHYFAQQPMEEFIPEISNDYDSHDYINSEVAFKKEEIISSEDENESMKSLFPDTIVKDGTVFYRHDESGIDSSEYVSDPDPNVFQEDDNHELEIPTNDPFFTGENQPSIDTQQNYYPDLPLDDDVGDRKSPTQSSNHYNHNVYNNENAGHTYDYQYPDSLDAFNPEERANPTIQNGFIDSTIDTKDKSFPDGLPQASSYPAYDQPTANQIPHEYEEKNMFDGILEQVHQPNPIDAVPHKIDDGGLTGGSGYAHRESEVQQVYTGPLPEGQLPDVLQKENATGIVTYAHIDAGNPPGPGELLTQHRKFSSMETENYIDSDLYEYQFKYDDPLLETYPDVTNQQVPAESPVDEKEFFPRFEFKNMISDDMSKFMPKQDRFLPDFSIESTTEPNTVVSSPNDLVTPPTYIRTTPAIAQLVKPGLQQSIKEIAPLRPGGPTIQVITLGKGGSKNYAPGKGVSLKAGQRIPGAEAYQIPPGFRARVFYGVPPPGLVQLTNQVDTSVMSNNGIKFLQASSKASLKTSSPKQNKLAFRSSGTLTVPGPPTRLVGTIPKKGSSYSTERSLKNSKGQSYTDCGFNTENCEKIEVPFKTEICQPVFISVPCCC